MRSVLIIYCVVCKVGGRRAALPISAHATQFTRAVSPAVSSRDTVSHEEVEEEEEEAVPSSARCPVAQEAVPSGPGTPSILTGELCPWTHFSLAEFLVLVGGAIPPAPVVPTSTRISARMKYVQGHNSAVSTSQLS